MKTFKQYIEGLREIKGLRGDHFSDHMKDLLSKYFNVKEKHGFEQRGERYPNILKWEFDLSRKASLMGDIKYDPEIGDMTIFLKIPFNEKFHKSKIIEKVEDIEPFFKETISEFYELILEKKPERLRVISDTDVSKEIQEKLVKKHPHLAQYLIDPDLRKKYIDDVAAGEAGLF